MNKNEYDFCKKIVNLDKKVSQALYYIKENYSNINVEFDEDNYQFIINTDNINEGQQVLDVKNYIHSIFDSNFISTNID